MTLRALDDPRTEDEKKRDQEIVLINKREALMKLRVLPEFRICPHKDYMRLIKHLGTYAEFAQIQVQNVKLTCLKHRGYLFIPCNDETITNCYYRD